MQLEHWLCEERLWDQGLFSLEGGSFRGSFPGPVKRLGRKWTRLFTEEHGERTGDDRHEGKQKRFRLYVRRRVFYALRTVQQRSRMPREVVRSPSLVVCNT